MSKAIDIARAFRGENMPTYTNTDNSNPSRCRGCGALYGMGHYSECFDRSAQVLKLPEVISPRRGDASWLVSHGKMLEDLYASGGSWNGK